MLTKKIDFALIIAVERANPNGDPLNGNRPRMDYEGYGEISDVCLKRKIRDRLLERYEQLSESEKNGQEIFVQSDDRKIDGISSLKARAESAKYGLGESAFYFDKPKKKDNAKKAAGEDVDDRLPIENLTKKKEETARKACEKWFDVRAFGQLFAFPGKKKAKDADDSGGDSVDADGVSIPVRGPVTIQSAFSVEKIIPASIQITKSVNLVDNDGKKSSDTIGMKHRVDKAVYVTFGSMNPQLSERTGFSDEDADVIKKILPNLFENDESSARPAGTMAIKKVIWWDHKTKIGKYSSFEVHKSLHVDKNGNYSLDKLSGLEPEEIP